MQGPPDALTGRFRRLEAQLAAIRGARADSETVVPDAVAAALEAIYDLWEMWKFRASEGNQKRMKFADEEAAVSGDADGETTVALVFARGGKTHQYVEFGVVPGFGDFPFGCGPFGGSEWCWQKHKDERPDYAVRSAWYEQRVAYRTVLPSLEAAQRWLRDRPELCTPRPQGADSASKKAE